jgi:hypothetical protein
VIEKYNAFFTTRRITPDLMASNNAFNALIISMLGDVGFDRRNISDANLQQVMTVEK